MIVLAVMAHPDDETIAIGGTLTRWASLGHQTNLLVMSPGGQGRGKHLQRCSEMLGVSKVAFGDVGAVVSGDVPGGGDVSMTEAVVTEVDSAIDRTQPNIVITHCLAESQHQAHRVVHEAVVNSVQRRGSTVHCLLFAEPTLPSNTFRPSVFIDVTQHIAAKLDAAAVYRSDMSRRYLDLDFLLYRAQYWGMRLAGAGRLAEPFELGLWRDAEP
jgi:LmbE family N-acetylglucosaminyl deacetylase